MTFLVRDFLIAFAHLITNKEGTVSSPIGTYVYICE